MTTEAQIGNHSVATTQMLHNDDLWLESILQAKGCKVTPQNIQSLKTWISPDPARYSQHFLNASHVEFVPFATDDEILEILSKYKHAIRLSGSVPGHLSVCEKTEKPGFEGRRIAITPDDQYIDLMYGIQYNTLYSVCNKHHLPSESDYS